MEQIKEMLGQNLKSIRVSQKLSREDLAKMTNVSAMTIFRIEEGKNWLTADLFERLVIALNVHPGALFDQKLRAENDEIFIKEAVKTDMIKHLKRQRQLIKLILEFNKTQTKLAYIRLSKIKNTSENE